MKELLLERFRQKDSPSLLLPLISDEELISVAHSWKFVKVDWEIPEAGEDLLDLPDNDLWDWMWEWVNWQRSELGLLTGLGVGVVPYVEKLRKFRLIYPDGTVAKSVEKFINSYVGRELVDMKKKKSAEKKVVAKGGDV